MDAYRKHYVPVTGRQVVGIDLHRRRSVIVRMTEDGRKLETVRITNSPASAPWSSGS